MTALPYSFDAPFVPDEPGERLNSDGSRDLTGLVAERDDGTFDVRF